MTLKLRGLLTMSRVVVLKTNKLENKREAKVNL